VADILKRVKTRAHPWTVALTALLTLCSCTTGPANGGAGSMSGRPGTATAVAGGVEGAGVIVEQDSSESGGLHWSVRWLQIEGMAGLNERAAAYARGQLTEFQTDYQPNDEIPPELNVGASVARAGDLAGVRFSTYLMPGASGATSHVTYYGSRNGWSVDSLGLIEPDQRKGLVERIRSTRPIPTDQAPATPETLLTDLVVRPGGDLVISVDQGLLGAFSDGIVEVRIPAGEAAAYLSERGREVTAAFASLGRLPETFTNPTAAPPAPQPEPTATNGTDPRPTEIEPPTPAPGSPTGATPAGALPQPLGGPVDCRVAKCVALTYDDGPGPHTARLLDLLEAAKAPATFFMLGQNANTSAAVVRRAAALGMVIANHTWDHRDLKKLSPTEQQREVDSARAVLRQLSGQPVDLLRPPYGSFGDPTRSLGAPLILWDVDTEDWKNRNAAATTTRALATVQAGSVILMHDIHPSSVDATPGIIATLRTRGFTLVTVPQLFGPTQPGRAYYSTNLIR
jgi:peptidoglycan/xylan/chitin deacetylase (PgdA/CDA1 family)